MGYQLGGTFKFKSESKVGVIDSKDAILGVRAFCRDEKTGMYREVLGCSQEQEWVDGTNEGGWFHHTWDGKDEAFKQAWKAYRWLNK